MNSPLSIVKDRFESKEKLVAAVKALATGDLWVGEGETSALDRVSNAKLLKLHRVFTAVKEQFGSRQKLIDAIATAEGRTKDEGYRSSLDKLSAPRLYQMFRGKKRG